MDRYQSQPAQQRALADSLLIEQACAGDHAAFEILVYRYESDLYHFVCTRLGSEEAQDVVQFVWFQFYRCISTLQRTPPAGWSDLSLKHWLLRVARNRCIDEQRRRKQHLRLFSTLEDMHEEDAFPVLVDPAPLPEECAERRAEQERLRAAIQTLPSRFRAIVRLRYAEGLAFSDIGHRLHMPTSTAKTYFYRACSTLRTALSSQLQGSPLSLPSGTKRHNQQSKENKHGNPL